MKFSNRKYGIQLYILLLILIAAITNAQDGLVDSTFGTNGFVMTTIVKELKRSAATDVLIQDDGKILASGTFDDDGRDGVVVVRYNPDGSLDGSFGEDGMAKSNFINFQVRGVTNGLALQSDGKIVVSGYAISATDYDLGLLRFTNDGRIDSTFGTFGKLLTPIGQTQDYSYDMVIQKDDKIVLCGAIHESLIIDAILVRYLPDGDLDDSFGTNGVVITDFSSGADDYRAIAIQPNGKIIAGGYSNNTSTGMRELAIAKYHSDGSLDASFDDDGKWTNSELIGLVQSIVVLNENKILIAGNDGGGALASFAKLNSDGTFDVAFGNAGMLKTNFEGSITDYPAKLLVQEDEKFIAVGQSYRSHFEISSQRFNSEGSVDQSFGSNGSFFIDLNGQASSQGNGAAMSNDGSIFIAGSTLNDKRVLVFSVLKLNNDSAPLTNIDDDLAVVKNFELHQNYPNPFNPTTTINYTIPTSELGLQMSELVSLRIYDILGNEVATLINKYQSPGSYDVTFDASNLSSGVYLYKLTAGKFSQTKKMMMLK